MVATAAPAPEAWTTDEVNLAMFMQAYDAREFGTTVDGVLHPTWEESGEFGRNDYLTDSRRIIGAMRLLGWKKS